MIIITTELGTHHEIEEKSCCTLPCGPQKALCDYSANNLFFAFHSDLKQVIDSRVLQH